MPTNPNMVAIQTVTVGAGGAASIEFTSIPQTYTDLVIKISSRSAFSTFINDPILLSFNGSTSSFSAIYLTTNGSSLFSGTFARDGGDSASSSSTSNTFSSNDIYIPNYTGSTNKSYSVDHVIENNGTNTNMGFVAGLWSNTAAITSITLTSNNGSNFLQYSTATLYGVTSAGYGAKATGGIISQDANYYYHTFLASGTFTPTQSISADCLVVAGGGGGGYYYGAGGGAGGVQWATSQSLTATGYTVTIGAGGASKSGSAAGNGTVGVDSSFSSLVIAKGGGYGAGAVSTAVAGGAGGSGGGAGGGNTAFAAGGAAVAGTGGTHYGNAGGGGSTGGAGGTGGGGGAGAVGGARVNSAAANGGVGLSGITLPALNAIGAATGVGVLSGGNYYIAGGGADSNNSASVGGLGGGGNWQGSGLANTGGGAGGDQNGGGGGSGVVVIRYAK